MKIMTRKIKLKITIEETAERHPVPVLNDGLITPTYEILNELAH